VPTNNVVPIDAEVARSIARRAIRFRWFVAGLTALWLAALIPVLIFTPLPALVPFLVLGALLVLAEHRFVLFGDETSMSGSIIVAIAAVFVFADTSPLAGPMLVASLGGLYLPHLREREIALALSNAAGFALSALGAAAAVFVIFDHTSAAWAVTGVSVFAAVSIDWLINSVVVGIASGFRGSAPVLSAVREQLTSDTDVLALVFAVGALTTTNSGNILTIAVIGIGVALAAFEIKLARRRQLGLKLGTTSDRILNASIVATTVSLFYAHPGLTTLAIAVLALFLIQTTDHLMTVPATVGFLTSGAVGLIAFAVGIPMLVVAAVVLTTAFAAIEVTTITGRLRRARSRISPWTRIGLLALSRREFACLAAVATLIGLLAPMYRGGVEFPLALCCALVATAAIADAREGASSLPPNYR
jgi:hypothetical protein